MDIGWPTE